MSTTEISEPSFYFDKGIKKQMKILVSFFFRVMILLADLKLKKPFYFEFLRMFLFH